MHIKRIAIGLVAAASLAFASPADAKPHRPYLPATFVRHQSWDILHDYKAHRTDNWDTIDRDWYTLKRRSRDVIDVKFTIDLTNDDGGCVEAPGVVDSQVGDSSEICPPDSEYREWWTGQRHAWILRFRAEKAYITTHFRWYFVKDPYADTEPWSSKFGGAALRKTDIWGYYE